MLAFPALLNYVARRPGRAGGPHSQQHTGSASRGSVAYGRNIVTPLRKG